MHSSTLHLRPPPLKATATQITPSPSPLMATKPQTPPSPPLLMDPQSGFNSSTKTFHSLRPTVPLPSPSLPLSFPSYLFSLLPSPLPSYAALIDASTSESISFSSLLSKIKSLSSNLCYQASISKGDVIFILSPARIDIPILYLSLLSLGVVVSPANPTLTPGEISRLVDLSKPSLAFATSSTVGKLPANLPTILIDSSQFNGYLKPNSSFEEPREVEIWQSDLAAIQFSSGTTGLFKAAALSHRCFIAMTAGFHARKTTDHQVTLPAAPMFHSMGFFFALKGIALAETTVIMTGARNTIDELIQTAEKYKVTQMRVAPPVVASMVKGEAAVRANLTNLQTLVCSGAPLHMRMAQLFQEKFPHVLLLKGYGSTECGGISLMISREESRQLKSVGRLNANVEAKIVDPETGKALSVGQTGEIWIKTPACMTGYIGDEEANAATFHTEGWLKTADLCYIDMDGFVHIVNRLKELIKYKAYQVAPVELEHVLQSLTEIVDAAVMPFPHEEAGQIPVALVVRQEGSTITESEVINYVAKQVAPYKKIRKVIFVDKIPKSPTGKILRRELSNCFNLLSGQQSRL
ncbi:hypothetical protein LUZ60_007536 [Juncus effusus]|nr:hypothetical protein LUZ60_007536 [Juncus effusus]